MVCALLKKKMKTNVFYEGDCLNILKKIPDESIDLIYLDPPFYNTGIQKGKAKWNAGEMELSYNDSKKFWGDNEKTREMQSRAPGWLKDIAIEEPVLASYLFYMMKRLQECHKVLNNTGSIYLHCDYRASHYLRMITDKVFGYDNFQNEIVWIYRTGGATKKRFSRKHDNIYFYTKTDEYTFNLKKERIYYKKSFFNPKQDEEGRFYADVLPIDSWDIPAVINVSKERLGYPTQKPEELLERIIKASSNKGDIVLDPFCGCGTAIAVAEKLGRKWIGIDINKGSFDAIKERFRKEGLTFNSETQKDYEKVLNNVMKMGGNIFEVWVNGQFNAIKPSPDRGVDGITSKGIAIQSKTTHPVTPVKYVSQFLTDARFHPSNKIKKPIKEMIFVSQNGYGDECRKLVYEIEKRDGIKIELLEPEDVIKRNKKE